MRIITSAFIFISLFTNANAAEVGEKTYRIERNKQYLATCEKQAVELHKGNIEKQLIIDRAEHYYVVYEIQEQNGFWIITCDLNNGEITKEQQNM
jgi:hypothetical protein